MYYVGCDLHKCSTWFYVMNESGNRVISKSIANCIDELHSFFSQIPKPFILAVEATYNWYFFTDMAEQYAQTVYLSDSYELKAFAKRHKKTDKIDAKLIADVLRKGYLPAVTIADKETRRLRELLRYRINLVKDRSRNISRMKGLLDKLGENSSGDFSAYKRLNDLELENLHLDYQKIITGYVEKIEHLNKKISCSDKEIKIKATSNEETMNLISIPGLKYFSSLIIKTEIIDINRFKTFNRLCAYAGLAPKVHQSGKTSIAGPLMKNRRKHLRWILLETVHHFVNEDDSRIRKFETIKKRKGYNSAKVVLARDMLKVIYRVLRENRLYYSRNNKSLKIRTMVVPALATV